MLAGGSGTRVGAAVNKVYLPLAGRSVIAHSLTTLAAMPEVGPVVLVVRTADLAVATEVLEREVDRADVEMVAGGASRQESELCGLRHLAGRITAGDVDAVLIHDGARPLLRPELAAAVLAAAREHGGAVPGSRRDDLATAEPGDDLAAAAAPGDRLTGRLTGPAPPGLVAVQTPQAFRAAPLLAAYEQAARVGFTGTDTASCVARFTDLTVRWLEGDPRNIKITYAHDLQLAEALLGRRLRNGPAA